MRIRCPHCHQQIGAVQDDPLVEMACPSCGSTFCLVDCRTDTQVGHKARQLGQFQLLEELGRGAFGSVWKAHDRELDRTVAVKLPRQQELDAVAAERFLREARAVAQLRHPGIVSIYEVGREGEQAYIVIDFIQGATLADWIDAKRVTFRQAAEIIARTADALQHAHDHGVVHRDLKPANILLDGSGRPYLTDFGLAKRDAAEITMTLEGQILGTPAYMSPEQARGQGHRVDARSDVYSLGVVLFELLTDELPFRGSTRMIIVQIESDEPPSPRTLKATVPRDLETIVLKCLAKEPDRRYQTASELAADLRRWLRGEPIRARRVGPLGRAWRWCRHKPATAGMLLSLVTLFVLLAYVATFPALAGLAIVVAMALLSVAAVAAYSAIQCRKMAQREYHARSQAEENYHKARQAVDEMLTEVGQQWLANVPQMENVRTALLEKALRFYQDFLHQNPKDPTRRLEAARARHRTGDIYTMLGQQQLAKEAYGEAIEALQQLVDHRPDKAQYQHFLAISHSHLGELLRGTSTETAEAEQAYRSARQLQQSLVSRFPSVPAYQQEWARTHNKLGILLQDTGRTVEAEAAFGEAIELLDKLHEQFPSEAKYQEELAQSHINLGLILKSRPETAAQAEQALSQAVELLDQLATIYPHSHDYRYKFAVGQLELGNLLLEQPQRRQTAEKHYRSSRDTLEKLIEDFPSILLYREELANSCNCLGSAQAVLGQLLEAEATKQQARVLLERLAGQFPQVPRYNSLLATTLSELASLRLQRGEVRHARQLVEAAIGRQQAARSAAPRNPDYRHRLCKHYVLLIEVLLAAGNHQLAIRRLKQITEQGYPVLENLTAQMRQELQQHEEFHQMLEQLT